MRYLIVKTSAFGDIIHAYPVLEFLKQIDPSCEVDWVVEGRMSGLVKSHPLISRCIEIDTKKWRSHLFTPATWKQIYACTRELRQTQYDALFDLQGNVKSSFITFLAHSRDKVGYGFKSAREAVGSFGYTHRYNPPLGLSVQSDYLFLVENYFNKKLNLKASSLLAVNEPVPKLNARWLVAPGSNWKNKQLTKSTLIAFLERCQASYGADFVFLCGNEQEEVLAKELMQKFPGSEILFKPSLPVLQHIMASLQLVLSMDSLPLHLAATAGCPTFSFFGPSSSQKYKPQGELHGSYQGICPYGETFERRCTKLRTCPTGACLREASPDALFASFQSWYHRP